MLPSASRKFTSITSKSKWSRVKAGDAAAISEHPDTAVKHIVSGMVWLRLKPLPPKPCILVRGDQDLAELRKRRKAGY